MHCPCGFDFADTAAKKKGGYQSYAIIRDDQYQAFLKSETKVLEAPDELSRIAAIAESSDHVGSALECPTCARLLFIHPGGGELRTYSPE